MSRRGLAACILASGIVFLDGSVVNVALPAMRADLDAGLAEQQWIVEAYLLTLGALILVGGSLGDLIGRKRVFTVGLVSFGVTSLGCAVAPDAVTLIAGRALQGVAGALLVPSSLAVIMEAYEEPERSAAIGSWTAWTGIAFVIGPLGGGALIEFVSWRWIFAVNAPLVAVALVLLTAIPGRLDECPERARIDWLGGVLGAVGLGGVVYALIERETAYGAAGAAALVAFFVHERRAAAPMLPLGLFAERNFAAGNLTTLAVYGGLGAMGFFVTIFLQEVAGYSPVGAGLALLPITLVLFALSRRAGALAGRVGARWFMAGGPLLCAIGTLMLSRLDAHVDYVADVLPGVLVFGLGLAVTVAPLTSAVLDAAPSRHAGVASGVNNAVARIASLLAIAGVGAIVTAALNGGSFGEVPVSDAADAFRDGLVASAVLLVLGGAVAAAGIRRSPQ